MTGRVRRGWLVAPVLAGLVAAGAGCSGSSTAPPSTPSISASGPPAEGGDAPDAGPRYRLPEHLCDVVDLTALEDLYPEEEPEDQHLLNSDGGCATAAIAGPGRVLGLSVDVSLIMDAAYDELPTLARTHYEQDRESAPSPTDIDGVGSAAFWYGNEYEIWLVAYHGNANIEVWAYAINGTHTLAPDMPERLVQVAAATLAALPQ